MFEAMTHMLGYRRAEKQANERALELLDFFGMADLAKAQAGAFLTEHRDALKSSARLRPIRALFSLTSLLPE